MRSTVHSSLLIKSSDNSCDFSKEPGLGFLVRDEDEFVHRGSLFMNEEYASGFRLYALHRSKGQIPIESKLLGPEGKDTCRGQEYDIVTARYV